jgi:type IV pilus assembly protein PilE
MMAGMPATSAQRGVTLIELAIVITIVGILSAFAYPAYLDRTQRAKRVDAKAALLAVAAQQERFFLRNNQFAATLDDLGIDGTENGYYDLSLDATATTFTVTATPPDTGSGQGLDETCRTFSIDQVGRKTATGAGGADASDKCWR